MDKTSATARLDAIEREAKEIGDRAFLLDVEAKALRAIIEAKKEPRGLCWVSFGEKITPECNVQLIIRSEDGKHYSNSRIGWETAIPLTEEEMRTYRGRWE